MAGLWSLSGWSIKRDLALIAIAVLSAQAPAVAAGSDAPDPLRLNQIDIGSVFDLTSQQDDPVKARHALRNAAADWLERQLPYFRIDRRAGLLAAPNPNVPRWDFNFRIDLEGNDVQFRVSDGGFRLSPHQIESYRSDEAEAFIGVRISW